jgi:hypothetical protein
MPSDRFQHEPDSIEELVIKASFVAANRDAEIIGEGLMEHKFNYYNGNDPSEWRTDVSNYKSITLRSVYYGVDLHFCGGSETVHHYPTLWNLSTLAALNIRRDFLHPASHSPACALGDSRIWYGVGPNRRSRGKGQLVNGEFGAE